jgi:hypothetical protein
MTERNREVPEALPAAEAANQPAPVTEASSGPTDDAFRAAAAYVLAKNAELYRRLAQGPTAREWLIAHPPTPDAGDKGWTDDEAEDAEA